MRACVHKSLKNFFVESKYLVDKFLIQSLCKSVLVCNTEFEEQEN
jgi:hypothetical protein